MMTGVKYSQIQSKPPKVKPSVTKRGQEGLDAWVAGCPSYPLPPKTLFKKKN